VPFDPIPLRALAIQAARAGASVLVPRFRTTRLSVGSKSSATDMVTDADKASEEAIIKVLLDARPDDAVLGEESGARPGTTGLRWVIDPLDGTTNFLYGIAQFCVSVAVEDEHGSVAGCVLDPIANEEFAAARGQGATLNGTPIQSSQATDLATSLVATGFSYLASERKASAMLLPTVLESVRDIRRAGSCALDLCSVAAGRVDAFYEELVFDWDEAAGRLIAAEAGATLERIDSVRPGEHGLLASAKGIADELRVLLARAKDEAGLRL
jgi:myo-inositol-1(or 4)-monophosphatase